MFRYFWCGKCDADFTVRLVKYCYSKIDGIFFDVVVIMGGFRRRQERPQILNQQDLLYVTTVIGVVEVPTQNCFLTAIHSPSCGFRISCLTPV